MYQNYLKRVIDITVSGVLIIAILPMWILVPIAIKLDDGGSVYYKADRIGKNGKKIIMFKFRTMKENSEDIRNEDGSTYNSENDDRVTKVGKILRKTSIDELPQLFNVLIGEMSVIGPRPSEWSSLQDYILEDMDKLKVKPGITGYTQAYYRNSITLREKRRLDVWYANNMTLLLDIKIIVKTLSTVLVQRDVYSNL